MNTGTPDRNVLIGALASVIMYVFTLGMNRIGFPITAEVTGPLAILVGFGLAHFIKPTPVELAAKIDNDIVKIAQEDPNSPVSLAKVIDDRIVRQAQLDPTSDVSYVIPAVPVPPGEAPTIVPPATK